MFLRKQDERDKKRLAASIDFRSKEVPTRSFKTVTAGEQAEFLKRDLRKTYNLDRHARQLFLKNASNENED